MQQLDQLTGGEGLPPHNFALSLTVASLNALLWIAMVVFAFVQVHHVIAYVSQLQAVLQASRVTGAGLGLKKSGVHIRSRPLQYSSSLQSDLDSFVLYTHAAKLRVSHVLKMPICY